MGLDEKLAASYPCRRAFLPVNRLEDGTVHDEQARNRNIQFPPLEVHLSYVIEIGYPAHSA